jgi:molecular chaperone GrpE (heat shock protein)
VRQKRIIAGGKTRTNNDKIEKKWANMKQASPDLLPQYDNIEKAIYWYLAASDY